MKEKDIEYFLAKAFEARERYSACNRRRVGAVLVLPSAGDNLPIIVPGGNYPVPNSPCRSDGSCFRAARDIASGTRMDECFAIHAEQNAIYKTLSQYGMIPINSILYVTNQPCINCMRLAAAVGIKDIVYAEHYNSDFTKSFADYVGIDLTHHEFKLKNE